MRSTLSVLLAGRRVKMLIRRHEIDHTVDMAVFSRKKPSPYEAGQRAPMT